MDVLVNLCLDATSTNGSPHLQSPEPEPRAVTHSAGLLFWTDAKGY